MSSTITWSSRWSRSTGCISTCGSRGWPTAAGWQGFFVGHRGYHYASTALMDPMTKTFVADIHGFVAARGLELVHFAKGQRKDDLAQEFLAKFTDDEGVLFVGRAQEKAGVWHTQRRHNPVDRGQLRLAGALDGVHQLLLLLLRGRRLRPVLPQVQHLLPLHRQAVHQRQRVGQAPGREGRDRVRAAGQRVRRGDDVAAVQAICDSLGPSTSTRCCASGCGSCPTRSPTPTRRPATGMSCRSCRPSSR